MAVTNDAFAAKVGCHFTMASRMRNGQRLPSVNTLIKISQAYDLPITTLTDAYSKGASNFGEFLRSNIFDSVESPELVA